MCVLWFTHVVVFTCVPMYLLVVVVVVSLCCSMHVVHVAGLITERERHRERAASDGT